MPKDNALITQESTEVVLRKASNIMNITNKILKNSKKALVANPEMVVIDGLMYQNQPFTERYTWEEAKEYASNLRLGGYDDWRLPTRKELLKLGNIKLFQMPENHLEWKSDDDKYWNDYEQSDIWLKNNKSKRLKTIRNELFFIDEKFIQNLWGDGEFISATTSLFDSDSRWIIDFSRGLSTNDYVNNHYYVICVRG